MFVQLLYTLLLILVILSTKYVLAQNTPELISEHSNFINFPGGTCPQIPLDKVDFIVYPHHLMSAPPPIPIHLLTPLLIGYHLWGVFPGLW